MLLVKDLVVSYSQAAVLKGVDLELGPGVHGVIGRNGSGKSTLMNAIYGLLKPKRGTVSYNAATVSAKNAAYFPSELFFYPKITGYDYIQLFRTENNEAELVHLCEILGLPIGDLIETYSHGTKKKLAIAGVLALGRPLLLLDEPFNGLDAESVSFLVLYLRKLAESGATIMLTSHVLGPLCEVSDDIRLLQDGKIGTTYLRNEFEQVEKDIRQGIEEDAERMLMLMQ